MDTRTMPLPMTVAEPTVTELVTLTPLAAEKLQAILQEQDLKEHGLRVFIAGSGCSGLQYGMAFENKMEDGDVVFESNGVRLYIDSASATYLEGTTVDYVDAETGPGFKLENPNAASGCSCGESGGCCGN